MSGAKTILVGLVALACCAVPAAARSLPEEPGADELRAEIHRFFTNRLRAELALSDAQTEAILPEIENLEETRRAVRRERAHLVRQLRQGLEEGAGDADLQALLDRLEALERDQRAAEREALARIDEQLTVRQRVKFRFFIEHFRRGLERRIEELRGGRPPAAPRRNRPGRPRPGRR